MEQALNDGSESTAACPDLIPIVEALFAYDYFDATGTAFFLTELYFARGHLPFHPTVIFH